MMEQTILNFSTIILSLMTATILFLSLKTISLQKKYEKMKTGLKRISEQKESLVYSLKHDFKVAVLAQLQILNLFSNFVEDDRAEIFNELYDSTNYSVKMLDMLSDIHSDEIQLNIVRSDLCELIQSSVENCENFLLKRKINAELNNSVLSKTLNIDKERFGTVFDILIQQISLCAQNDQTIKINLLEHSGAVKVSFEFETRETAEHAVEKIFCEYPQFASVGQGIKVQFLNKILALYESNIEIKIKEENLCEVCFLLHSTGCDSLKLKNKLAVAAK